jgi:ABC-type maltose transport system permease subunit
MMVPGQVLLIPNFLILDQLGWLDTFYALTVPWLSSVFTIFLMRQFFMTVPNDLWEAAASTARPFPLPVADHSAAVQTSVHHGGHL